MPKPTHDGIHENVRLIMDVVHCVIEVAIIEFARFKRASDKRCNNVSFYVLSPHPLTLHIKHTGEYITISLIYGIRMLQQCKGTKKVIGVFYL